MNGSVAAEQAKQKAFFYFLGEAFGFQQVFYIKQVAGMLAVKSRNDLPAEQLPDRYYRR
jgi:hypothetical protein